MAKTKEQSGKTVAKVAEQTTAVAKPIQMGKFQLKKRLTLPTLVLKEMAPMFLRIEDKIRESTYVDPDPSKSEKPADICTVTDMETGETSLLLVPALLKSTLERDYMENSVDFETVKTKSGEKEIRRVTPIPGTEKYVGLIFAVQKLPKRPGKRYHDFEIAEVEEGE